MPPPDLENPEACRPRPAGCIPGVKKHLGRAADRLDRTTGIPTSSARAIYCTGGDVAALLPRGLGKPGMAGGLPLWHKRPLLLNNPSGGP